MDPGKLVWKNGEMVKLNSKKTLLDVSNHSLNYGSAVFEGIRFYETPNNAKGDSAIFRLEDHVDRLFYSASAMGNDIRDFSKKDICNAIIETVKVNGFKEGYVRPIVYFEGGIGIDFGNEECGIAKMILPWKRYSEKALKVHVPKLRRPDPRTTDVNAKISGNYHNSVLAHKESREAGYDECLQLDCEENIAEGPGENIFFVKDKKLITPSLGNILPGITRYSILTIGRGNGLGIEEKVLDPSFIEKADEAFFCGTAVEVSPISEINYLGEIKYLGKIKKYDTHEVTNQIRDSYMNTVRGKNGHIGWLTFIK